MHVWPFWLLALLLASFVGWRFVWFLRNPSRDVPTNPDHIISPADGKILYIRNVSNTPDNPIFSIKNRKIIYLRELMHIGDESLARQEGVLIGVFMGPFDVHYNRAPIAGRITKIGHYFPGGSSSKGENASMYNALSNLTFGERPYFLECDHIIDNERASYLMSNREISLYVTQIADRWISNIVTFRDDEDVEQGEVFGLIRMGSQVDVFVPGKYGFRVRVEEGDRVKAGMSVLLERAAPNGGGDLPPVRRGTSRGAGS